MSLNGISQRYRPGVLAVSPPDEIEMPDEYLTKARAEIRADKGWIADQIAEGIDETIVDLLADTGCNNQRVRGEVLCNRLRAIVAQAVEREAPDLAESLWKRDIEASQDAAAEYAADRD